MKSAVIFNGPVDNITLKKLGDTFSSSFIPSLMKTTRPSQDITVYVGRNPEDTEIVNRSGSFNSLKRHVRIVTVILPNSKFDLYSKIYRDGNTYVVCTTSDFESFIHMGWLSASQDAIRAHNGIGLSLCSGSQCRSGVAVLTSHHLRLFPTCFPRSLPQHLRLLWLKQVYEENDCHCTLPCGTIKKQKRNEPEESGVSYSEELDERVENDAQMLRSYRKEQISQLNEHLEDQDKELESILKVHDVDVDDMEGVD